MLKELKFVQGAIAKKDFVPVLTHFHMESGRISGFNGIIAVSTPIDLDIEARPRAVPFVKAVQTCKDETIALSMTNTGKLAIKSGKFRAYVDCSLDPFPLIVPEGEMIPLDHGIIKDLKTLHPFIAQDASRPWATGILFRNGSAFATNNVILMEKWLGYTFPYEVNIPAVAVNELLRIGEDPIAVQFTHNRVVFHFEGDRWLASQLGAEDWPDISAILNRESSPIKVPEGFFSAVEDLSPFTDERDRIIFGEGMIRTAEEPGAGAIFEIPELVTKSSFQSKQLLLLNGVIDTIDFTQYPKPCCFFGDNLRGAIIGMHL